MAKLLIWLILCIGWLNGETLVLGDKKHYTLQENLFYLEDPKGILNIDEIGTKAFIQHDGSNVNFGFTKSVYWFRFEILRSERSKDPWWLFLNYPLLEHIDIFQLASDGKLLSHNKLGSKAPLYSHPLPIRNDVCELQFDSSGSTTVYIRVQTQSSMQIPIQVYSSSGLIGQIEKDNIFTGLYYGIFLIILLYNIIIYFYTKDSNYLRYLLFLMAYILWQSSFDGTGIEYLWNESPWIIEHGPNFWIALTGLTSLYFGRYFLNTPKYVPTMDKFILIMAWVAFAIAVSALLLPYGKVILFNATTAIITPTLLFISGIMVLRNNYRPARFYVAGWTTFFIGTIIFTLNKFEVIPSFSGVNHVQQIGSAIEMIFLSWALADRVHLLQKEYIDKLNHLNETLSEKVNDALNFARNKDQLFVQQSRLAALGEMIEQIAHQWRQPLNTLALLNQDLYVKYKLGQCNDEVFENSHSRFDEYLQYMSKTIDDFRNYYRMDKEIKSENLGELVRIALRLSEAYLNYSKVVTDLVIIDEVEVVLAKNEMIQVLMNLIKNAYDAMKERKITDGKIIITLSKNKTDQIVITVEDNAGGISPDIIDHVFDIYFTTKTDGEGTGLGLHMARYIVEQSFNGSISVENKNGGACFIITL